MMSKDYYSTGEVSEILNISRATVSRKFDAGIFAGKKNPITGERLISHESLVAFMSKYDLPVESVTPDRSLTVLLSSADKELQSLVERTLSNFSEISLHITDSGYDSLIKCSMLQPDLFILDEGLEDINCSQVFDSLNRQELNESMKSLCILKQKSDQTGEPISADHLISRDSLTIDSLLSAIDGLLGLTPSEAQVVSKYNHKRQWPRIPVNIPADVELYLTNEPDLREQGTTNISDISVGGAYLSDIQLNEGQIPFGTFRIHLEVKQPPLDDWTAECKIIRLRANGSITAGVEFVNISQQDRMKISDMVR